MRRSPCAAPLGLALAAVVALAACNPSLPEPDSAGAKLYAERCASCHRLYAPGVMTLASWDVILPRMQREMVMRRVAPLSAEETKILRDYLAKHALPSPESPGGTNDGS